MPAARKIFAVQNLAKKFEQAKALILTDYAGLKVSQINELRRELKKAGAEFEVVKNSLLQLAAKNGKWKMENGKLTGPTAALWLYQADPTPLKTFMAFVKKNELPKIKLGLWQGELISEERVWQLANLPSLSELQVKFVGLLNSPIYRLVNSLNWNLKKLLLVLGAASTQVTAAKEGVKNNG